MRRKRWIPAAFVCLTILGLGIYRAATGDPEHLIALRPYTLTDRTTYEYLSNPYTHGLWPCKVRRIRFKAMDGHKLIAALSSVISREPGWDKPTVDNGNYWFQVESSPPNHLDHWLEVTGPNPSGKTQIPEYGDPNMYRSDHIELNEITVLSKRQVLLVRLLNWGRDPFTIGSAP